jgi:vacuolar-type H+-ATPase subunit E/Vma4
VVVLIRLREEHVSVVDAEARGAVLETLVPAVDGGPVSGGFIRESFKRI